jgi:hypothetical protein
LSCIPCPELTLNDLGENVHVCTQACTEIGRGRDGKREGTRKHCGKKLKINKCMQKNIGGQYSFSTFF